MSRQSEKLLKKLCWYYLQDGTRITPTNLGRGSFVSQIEREIRVKVNALLSSQNSTPGRWRIDNGNVSDVSGEWHPRH